ncbi:putative ribonuclease H protein [Sesamum angolense]|uniref:Ribonuclease H protein n=1 Tax=Sesamum angolense TaxID=2727404 RepID=A0AAE1W2R3_9LAMI|nr:putative ribonuclease H protein [Sesamum angolense]
MELILEIPINPQYQDVMHWKPSLHGSFSTKLAWEITRDHKPPLAIFKNLWPPLVRPTISIFIWKVLHNWIPVDSRLKQKGIFLASKCVCCLRDEETIPHLFLHNKVSLEVWSFFASKFQLNILVMDNFSMILQAWKNNISNQPHIRDILPLLIMWNVWICRNAVIFEGAPFKANRIISGTLNYFHLLGKTNLIRASHWKGDKPVASHLKIPVPQQKISSRISIVKWIKPDRGWFKLNTDGASKGNPGIVGAGGIIRNHLGQTVLAFQEHLGLTSNTTAELKAIYRGIKLCIDSNIRKIWVETDANVALKLISSPSQGP